MMMTNGIGAVLGSSISGFAIDKYFTSGAVKTGSRSGFPLHFMH